MALILAPVFFFTHTAVHTHPTLVRPGRLNATIHSLRTDSRATAPFNRKIESRSALVIVNGRSDATLPNLGVTGRIHNPDKEFLPTPVTRMFVNHVVDYKPDPRRTTSGPRAAAAETVYNRTCGEAPAPIAARAGGAVQVFLRIRTEPTAPPHRRKTAREPPAPGCTVADGPPHPLPYPPDRLTGTAEPLTNGANTVNTISPQREPSGCGAHWLVPCKRPIGSGTTPGASSQARRTSMQPTPMPQTLHHTCPGRTPIEPEHDTSSEGNHGNRLRRTTLQTTDM
ncbi:hypothetical protein BKP42_53840 [Rhodococcus erythropolis]|nr:hypothetical protein BKP42_53840 [Rhodococcus erythropolis]